MTPRDYDPKRGVEYLQRATGLGRDTVRCAIRTGALPGYYVAGRYTVPAEAFDAFCAGTWVPQHRPVFSQDIKPITTFRRVTQSA